MSAPNQPDSTRQPDIVQQILARYWGFDSFLPLQREAIQSVLDNRDSLVVMPTGGGKSLCYRRPRCVAEGVAVVVSPLLALNEGPGRWLGSVRRAGRVGKQHARDRRKAASCAAGAAG